MKRSLPVILSILLAAAVIMLVMAWREVSQLRDELAAVRKEREEKPRSPAVSPAAKPVKPAAGSPEPVTAAASTDKAGKEKDDGDQAGAFIGATSEEIQKRSDARIALLRSRLNLRPDQVTALEKAAAARTEALLAAIARLGSDNGRPPDLGLVMDWMTGHFELPVKEALDAEQAELFKTFEREDRAGHIENLVSIEMMEIHGQGALHLTPEQKDQAFAALSEINLAEVEMGDGYFADDGQFSARIEESLRRRKEALAGILDAAQLAEYSRMLDDDGKLIAETFPAANEGAAK